MDGGIRGYELMASHNFSEDFIENHFEISPSDILHTVKSLLGFFEGEELGE